MDYRCCPVNNFIVPLSWCDMKPSAELNQLWDAIINNQKAFQNEAFSRMIVDGRVCVRTQIIDGKVSQEIVEHEDLPDELKNNL